MSYIKPQDVKAPQEHWKLTSIIYDAGEGNVAMALGEWDESRTFALRWNGTEASPNGNPSSSSRPTWFILPDDFGFSIVNNIFSKHVMGNYHFINEEGMNAAIDWMHETENLQSGPDATKY